MNDEMRRVKQDHATAMGEENKELQATANENEQLKAYIAKLQGKSQTQPTQPDHTSPGPLFFPQDAIVERPTSEEIEEPIDLPLTYIGPLSDQRLSRRSAATANHPLISARGINDRSKATQDHASTTAATSTSTTVKIEPKPFAEPKMTFREFRYHSQLGTKYNSPTPMRTTDIIDLDTDTSSEPAPNGPVTPLSSPFTSSSAFKSFSSSSSFGSSRMFHLLVLWHQHRPEASYRTRPLRNHHDYEKSEHSTDTTSAESNVPNCITRLRTQAPRLHQDSVGTLARLPVRPQVYARALRLLPSLSSRS
ncbi:hypothetical protein BDV96DRAFT_24992 [Lophiotrema nucula]|uniref:Uncharacterized protein n=1 Tax=Lophiotrema nucula TaxID=690887 RepID=A0A6A5ZD09_9PLEO|nr:hypothetical protein BDV96DRAFT_24992 [Lophiotrema nucula]